MQLKILNRKDIKRILEMLKNQFGFGGELDYAFFLSTKGRLYILNRETGQMDLENLRMDSIGLYFGELKDNDVRLTIDGSQLIGPKCTKGIVEIDDDTMKTWFRGENIPNHLDYRKVFVILKNGNDYLGCGRANGDEITNMISKSRKLDII